MAGLRGEAEKRQEATLFILISIRLDEREFLNELFSFNLDLEMSSFKPMFVLHD